MEQKTDRHIFSADRPISTLKEDRLNRGKFAQELAKSISQWVEKDSLVLAIYGQWGDGKSSVKNLIKEVFEKEKKSSPVVMEFSPWQWSGDEHLTEAFFKEIANKLGQSDDAATKKVAAKILEYAEYLELSNELFSKAKDFTQKVLIALTGSLSFILWFLPESSKFWLQIITVILFLITLCLEQIIWLLKFISRYLNISLKRQTNLEDKKADLIKSLSLMKKPLIVIMDDIDRLCKSEIKTIFRIIKANADFPNIVYLTFFQRDIVENSLDEDQVYKGREYLKKIVQIGFDLPKVPINEIHNILFRELDKLLEESKLNQKFEKNRWNELFMNGLGDYFRNLRDVNRFLSTFSFHLGVLKNNESYEVNFIDLVGLEVLRQFEPKVYEQIYFSKKLLTASASHGSSNYEKEAHKKQMEQILNASSDGMMDSVKAIIKVLFPNTEWAWGSNYHSDVGDNEFITLRINHEDRFNRYFSLYIPNEDISQAEFDHALSITNDEEKFFAFLFEYYEQGRLPLFIKKFESYKQHVSKEHAKPFISAILRIGDFLSDERSGFFTISPLIHTERIIHWYFKKQDFTKNKKDTFWEILKESKAIFLPINILWEEFSRRKADKSQDLYIFSEKDTDNIKALIIEKINVNKNFNSFKNNIHLPRILFIWLQIQKDEAHKWLSLYIQDDENLLTFLMKIESVGYTSSGYETKVDYYIPLNWLNQFFDNPQLIIDRVKKLKEKTPIIDERVKRVFTNLERTEDEIKHPEKYRNGRPINNF